jgi:hypothetical protein
MFTQIKIANYKADAYLNKPTCTIDIKDADFIQINDRVIKNELKDCEEYVTIKANDGGAFSPDWEKSDLKILFILMESYILKKSYYEYGDRGGHKQNEEYDDNNELWGNSTYRNVVKICYFIYHSKLGIPLKDVDFKRDDVWNEACDIFRKHAAVICANPFPGLAFSSKDTDPALLVEWLKLPEVQELLKEKIGRLDPKYIYAVFDLGLVSSYSHLFGWLKERTLNELVGIEGAQRVFDSEIVAGGVAVGRTYAVDKNGRVWIQGTHPSRISHKKTKEFASAIFNALRTL